jgi:hypothetical protein
VKGVVTELIDAVDLVHTRNESCELAPPTLPDVAHGLGRGAALRGTPGATIQGTLRDPAPDDFDRVRTESRESRLAHMCVRCLGKATRHVIWCSSSARFRQSGDELKTSPRDAFPAGVSSMGGRRERDPRTDRCSQP